MTAAADWAMESQDGCLMVAVSDGSSVQKDCKSADSCVCDNGRAMISCGVAPSLGDWIVGEGGATLRPRVSDNINSLNVCNMIN